jgi:hypothetical protein
LQIAAGFLLLASSGGVLAQSEVPWRGSIECRLDVEQPGYSRHEIQTWTLTGAELPRNGDMRIYAADWTYRGSGGKNQNAAAAEWSVEVPPTSAPLAMFVRAADQRLIVRLWHSQVTSAAGIRVRNGLSNQTLPATEWQLPWIEAAPSDDLAGTVSVQTAAVSVAIAELGVPPPTAACTYRISRTAASVTPVSPQTTQNTGRGSAVGRTPGSAVAGFPLPAAPPPTGPVLTAAVEECSLAGPAALQASNVTPGRARLAWNAAAGATGYMVARNDIGAVTPTPITALNFQHDYVLDSRVTYQYSVTAVYANGCGTSTIPVKAEALTAGDLHVTTGAGNLQSRRGRVTLIWRADWSRAELPSAFVVLGPGADQGVNVPPVPRPTGELGAERDTGTFAVELDNVPEGQHTWRIAAAWDTPAGRSLTWDTAAEVTARVGFFRVLITGFKSNFMTIDDMVNTDGEGDEIYVGAAAYINGEAVALAHSAVHGNVGIGPQWADRVKAGTLRASGGITDGDAFPSSDPSVVGAAPSTTTFPFLVWEGWLGGETRLLVNPSVWESDGDLTAFNAWQELMLATHPTLSAARSVVRDNYEGAVDRATEVAEQAIVRVDPRDPVTPGRVLEPPPDESPAARAAREAIRQRRNLTEQADTTAMQLIPLRPFRDRYIGTISKTPELAFLSTSSTSAVGLTYVDPRAIVVDVVPVVLGGSYTIYVAIVPAN